MDRWCERRALPRGESISLDQCWRLAKTWYHDRLDPAWQRMTPDDTQAVFTDLGPTGESWRFAERK